MTFTPTSYTPEMIKRIKTLFREHSNSLDRIQGEKDFQKDAIEEAAEELNIDKGILKKAADRYHKQDMVKVTTEFDEVRDLVQTAIA